MNICKHYVNNKCTNKNCRFHHIDNICKNHFFGICTYTNCKYSHEYKFENKETKNKETKNKENHNLNKIKNTESFVPNLDDPSIRIKFNSPILHGNEISISNNVFHDNNLFNKLLIEINNDVYKPWHGDTHLIADDSHSIDWKSKSETFEFIIRQLSCYFCMTPAATRLNYYTDSIDWKPYHHDAAAFKPNKAKTQNITVGVSLGETREISFESIHKNINERIRINFPLENGTVYSFGNNVNIDFRHGIPQLREKNNNGRISIIIWGYSSLLN